MVTVRYNPGYLAGRVEEVRRQAAPPDPRAVKWDCRGLARVAGGMTLFAEVASDGDPLFAPHGPDVAAPVPQLLGQRRKFRR